jgi:ABC-2 type transport system ATP-binding protein
MPLKRQMEVIMSLLLELKDLTKAYGEKLVVNKVGFSIREGEILGFIGPNGAGKTTTIKLMIDLEKRDSGEILYQETRIDHRRKEYKASIGVVPQEIALYEDMSAYDNVKFFCSLYGCRGTDLKNRVKKSLEFVGLWERRKELLAKYSGGMKRRLNIACSIAHSPKLLIMDEPTVGIDPQSRNHIMAAIKTLNQRGTSIIYVSHYMEEIEAVCWRIVIMDHGVIVADMEKEALKNMYRKQGLASLEDIFLKLTGTQLRDEEA